MKQMTTKILLLAAFSAAGLEFAQTVQKLTLSEAIVLSMKNNSKVKIAEAQLNTMDSKVQEAKNKRLPDLKLSGNLMKPFNTMEIKSELPFLNGGGASPSAPDYVAIQQLNLGMPLFAGFKIKNGIAVAEYQKSIQQYQLENDKQDIALAATQGFVNLYKAKQAISVINENLSRSHQRSVDFEKLELNGVVARNDLMRVKLQESNVKLSLADAKKNVNVLNYSLGVILGLAEGTEIDPEIGGDEAQEFVNEQNLQEQSLQQRQEYKILSEQEKVGKANVEIAKAAYYPTVSLTAGYINAWMPNILQINHMTMAGLSLSYDLANLYKNRATVQTAKLQQVEIQENKKALNDKVKTDIHNAFEDYQLQNEKIKVYEEAVGQANENYKVVKNKFDNGLATTTDLLTADVEQLQAQLNLVYGKADKKWSYFNLLRQTGEIKY
ncbi:transporter [Elizabethkingia ursingii]|uniref:TolC family protein n=2 Tax=Elizabethkingia ursingii TaxID=1756150 RepID=UPI00075070BD|nr:TolC family protein [Elizabethkingia ursingii]KUY26276.1 transporter [Elizabethkingia ursingii]MDR2230387.1 TolC family protein [Flavobacteriaceae bacterium]OPC01373.1 transporter [Elizabethkingia ursingii]